MGLVVHGVLAVGVTHLWGRGQNTRDGGDDGIGAGGFWEEGCSSGADGGRGRHGDLDQLITLDEADQSLEALQWRLRVSLLTEEMILHVLAFLQMKRGWDDFLSVVEWQSLKQTDLVRTNTQ